MSQSPPIEPTTDRAVLKALSHPSRRTLLRLLESRGQGRATDLAQEIGATTNLASFHLRVLANAGLIEEVQESGRDARNRVWRPVRSAVSIDQSVPEADRDLALGIIAALAAEQQGIADRLVADSAANLVDGEAADGTMMAQFSFRGTRAQMEHLQNEFADLVHHLSSQAGQEDPDARNWTVFLSAGDDRQ